LDATAWQFTTCAITSRVAFSRESRHFAPFSGVLPPFCHPTGFESGRAHSPSRSRKTWLAPTATWPLSSASRPRPHGARPAGSGRAQTLPRWLLPATDHRIGKDRTGPDLDERPLYFSMRQARRFLRTKSTYSSPLVAAQPLTIPSWQEGLDATFLVFEPRCLHRWRR